MHANFKHHRLNDEGLANSQAIAEAFDELLTKLTGLGCAEGREFAVAKTKLEEACFFAKKSMAVQAEFQAEQA